MTTASRNTWELVRIIWQRFKSLRLFRTIESETPGVSSESCTFIRLSADVIYTAGLAQV